MSKQKSLSNFRGKGYYIALILCALAIGITGYLYYRTASDEQPQLDHQGATQPTGDVQAVATAPGDDPTVGTQPPTPGKSLKTGAPASGNIIVPYSMDALAYNQTTRDWRVHDGIDIAAEAGAPVYAAADGTVYTVFNDDTMGTTVVIRHDGGYTTSYSSMSEDVKVAPGDTVKVGQVIGSVGQTALLEYTIGDHLHFSVTVSGEAMDPEDFLTLG